MTKELELQRFIEFARNFPDNSYLKPWMQAVIPELEQCMKSDIIPHISITEEMEKVRELRDQASTLAAENMQRSSENKSLAQACHLLRSDKNTLITQLEEMGHRCLDAAKRPS